MSLKADGAHHFPMTGVEIWKNPKNKFAVFQCHYTADPDKRSEEYRKEKESSLSRRRYLMEYELRWESFSGLPVFGDTWNERVHSTKEELEPEIGLPLLIGFDFGLTPACLIAQLCGPQLRGLRELVAVNMGADRFATLVLRELALHYAPWSDLKRDVFALIDPSGMFRKDTDEGTCAKILDERGFKNIMPGAIAFEERRTSVEKYLTQMSGGEPNFLVSAKHCPMLVKGFNGGYQFKEGQDEIESSKLDPLKNEFSHIHDALQMITSRVGHLNRSVRANVPIPRYTWSR